MADKYYRLVCFLVDICAEVLRECFVKLAKNDRGSSYTTVEAYIAFRRHNVYKLLSRKKIREDQYNLLYPSHGTADENKWDVTLLVTLITELFAANLKPLEILTLKNEIREIRNDLHHYPNTADMSDDDFDMYWKRLDDAIMLLANNMLNPHVVVLLRDKINKEKCNNLPNIGDCLRSWYEESRKRYEERIDQLESKLSEIESKTKETNDILRQVTVQKPGPTEEQLNSELCGIKRGMKKQSGASVAKRSRSKGPQVLSVKETVKFNIRTNCDKSDCNIRGSCFLPSGEIMLLDIDNDKLKTDVKAGVKIHSIIDQLDVCYTGDNVAVVLSNAKLSFLNTADDMRLIRSVEMNDNIRFKSLTCYDDKLYIRDDVGYIYIYGTDGVQQQILYVPPKFGDFFTSSIAISDDGSKLYVPYLRKLVTIDNTGKELFSLKHEGICTYSAVCVGNQGHVYVSTDKKCVLKISADGTTIERVIPGIYIDLIYTMLYDRENSALVVAGGLDTINIYSLEK